jgi:UDP-N-acetyl-D-glucosamine dehydrogenase
MGCVEREAQFMEATLSRRLKSQKQVFPERYAMEVKLQIGEDMNTTTLSSPALLIEERFRKQVAHVGVIGLGYVGLPLSLLFAEAGFQITCLDIDEKKIQELEAGRSYIYRIPSVEIERARLNGLRATSDFSQIAHQDAVVICVPTPLNVHKEPDLSFVENTVRTMAPWIREHQLIVLESTTYPGTTEEIVIPILEKMNRSGLKASIADEEDGVFHVAFSPEREDPGNDTVARCDIPKVVGGHGSQASLLACALYGAIFRQTVRVSSTRVAEMTKLLENIYRCVNIALVNELKQLCLKMGINIWEVIGAASSKPFGFHPFFPGPGLGGHCIPIDPFYLSWKAKEYDFATRFIELAGEVNEAMPYFVVRSTMDALNLRKKSINGSRILVLGVAYKKDIDDLRESPALIIIEEFRRKGAAVDYHDPYFPKVGGGRHYHLNMQCVSLDDIGNYDAVVIVTDHSEYKWWDIVRKAQLVIDTRNATRGIESSNIVHA